ncbi:hypothetical protein KSP39_PZI000284 [Platanthera zijinensis]|uniref:Uncharacterized protein n=1 Tax=Platanthera zijinensis TaxID=2320716 RepID=A0AAP0B0Q5_9ASPA
MFSQVVATGEDSWAPSSVKEVVQLIAGSPEIRANPDLYYFALDHIRDKTTREILMSIPEEDRVWWIKQAYERRAH